MFVSSLMSRTQYEGNSSVKSVVLIGILALGMFEFGVLSLRAVFSHSDRMGM